MLANLLFLWQTALIRSYESSVKVFELELLENGEEEGDSHLYADASQTPFSPTLSINWRFRLWSISAFQTNR